MKFTSIGVIISMLFFFISGCLTSPSMKDDKALNALVGAIVENDKKVKDKKEKYLQKAVTTLNVRKSGRNLFVDANLDHAPIPFVITKLLNDSKLPYSFDKSMLYGNITVRFKNKPLLKAMNLILSPISLTAVYKSKVLTIKDDLKSDPSIKYVKVPLKNIDIKTASSFLEGMYPPEQRSINFGALPQSNTIYLSGPANEVSKAMQLLSRADRDISHVVIEVLVVEFSEGVLEDLGAKIDAIQDGKFEGRVDYMSSGNGITFGKWLTDAGEYNNFLTSFRAALDILVSDNKARLISRPYISTLSGKKAAIEIASDRYLLVDKENGVSAAEPVRSGVILEITPTVMSGNRLRMEVHVEDSQFSRITLEGISTEVNKNSATTLMQVEDGQTIIIGGLISNRRAYQNTGFPWLRNIPGLNILFSNRSDEVTKKEVSIYVTPHIWKPSMMSPTLDPKESSDDKNVKSIFKKYK